MSEQYFEEKPKEFYDLKLGSMTMKELCSKFLSLLRYVPYLIDEKPKVQRFLSCLPLTFKDRIEYDNPKTLEEAMRRQNSVMNKARIRGIMHLTGRLKEEVTKNIKTLKTTGILGVTPEISLKPISRMLTLKETHSRIQSKEKKGNHLLAIIITTEMQLKEDP